MQYASLKAAVWQANKALVEARLVTLTWGNASAVDREAGVMAIKPSGVPYEALSPDTMVVVDLVTGVPREQAYRPSSDTPTHRYLYQQFPMLGGIVHTHAVHATSWAQAGRSLPCLGTTHADHFYGPIPITRPMRPEEIREAYEHHTGEVIVECFLQEALDPLYMPAVLVAGHGPFTWGPTVQQAVENAIALEAVAQMALYTLLLNPQTSSLNAPLLDKHFLRKHGSAAYYGQGERG